VLMGSTFGQIVKRREHPGQGEGPAGDRGRFLGKDPGEIHNDYSVTIPSKAAHNPVVYNRH
jgi:hypothetical protein